MAPSLPCRRSRWTPRTPPSPLDCKKDSGRLGARLASLLLPAYKFAMSVASNAEAAASAAALELVGAVADNDVIGRGNQVPVHLPAELRHFPSPKSHKALQIR